MLDLDAFWTLRADVGKARAKAGHPVVWPTNVELAGVARVAPATVSRWLSGRGPGRIIYLERLARFFERELGRPVPITALLAGSREPDQGVPATEGDVDAAAVEE